MPSVASEVQNVLTARAQLPSSRSLPDAEARQSATPFTDLLDSAAPAEPSARSGPVRADQADQANAPKSSRDRGEDAAPAPGRADGNDARDANGAAEANDEGDAKVILVAARDGDIFKADADKPAAAGDKAKPDADVTAAAEAMFVDPTPPATAPQAPLATSVTLPVLSADVSQDAPRQPDVEAEALPATPAAGEDVDGQKPTARQAAPQVTVPQIGATKPAQTAANSQGDDQAPQTGAPATNAQTVDPKAVPQVEGGPEGQARGKDQTGANDTHRTFADLLATTDTDAASQTRGDTATLAKAGSDPAQNLVMTAPSAGSAATATTPANPSVQVQAPTVSLAGLAIEIVKEATAGKHQFEIRLDPPELGRIDVRLSVDHDGRVTSHLVADRADTLDLLKRDASQLERALQQAGLKTSDNALEFSLRQQAFARDDAPAQGAAQLIVPDDDPAPLEALRQGYGRLLGLGGGLDIRV